MRYVIRITLIFLFLLISYFPYFFITSCKNKQLDKKEKHEVVRLLGWIGYDEADLLDAVRKNINIEVEVKTYQGGTEMLSILESDTSSYDVVVLDPEYIAIARKKNLLQPLDINNFDLSIIHPFFQELDLLKKGRDYYAIPVRFGIVGILYNSDRVNEEEIRSYSNLFNEKFKNRISIIDLWQPVMGVISMSLGNRTNPYNLNDIQLEAVKKRLLDLKRHGTRIHKTVMGLIESLNDESAWIMLGGGEANAWTLHNKGKNFNWLIPEEGGILWMESLGIVKNAINKERAIKLIKYLQSAEGLALLAKRKAYISSPTSIEALKFFTDEELKIRGISNKELMTDLLNQVVVRRLPNVDMFDKWDSIWKDFKKY